MNFTSNFGSLNLKAQKSAKTMNGDTAPILRVTQVKNTLRINSMLGADLDVVAGDFIRVYQGGTDTPIFAISKDIKATDEHSDGAAKLAGSDAEITTAGAQTLTFRYSGMYGAMVNNAAKVLNFDPTAKVEVQYAIEKDGLGKVSDIDPESGDDSPLAVLRPISFKVIETAVKEEIEEDTTEDNDVEFETED